MEFWVWSIFCVEGEEVEEVEREDDETEEVERGDDDGESIVFGGVLMPKLASKLFKWLGTKSVWAWPSLSTFDYL